METPENNSEKLHGFDLREGREMAILCAGRAVRFIIEFCRVDEIPPTAWQFLVLMRVLWPDLADELDREDADEEALKLAKKAKIGEA